MSVSTQARLRAGVVIVTPVVVLIGFIWAPYLSDFTDNSAVADEIAANTTRWNWAAIISGVGLALTPLLAFSIRNYLREAGEQRWSFIAVPLVTIGAGLLAFLAGSEFATGPAIDSGASGSAVLDAREDWFMPMIFIALAIFAAGFLSLAAAVRTSRVLSDAQSWVVVGALVVLAVSLFIPVTGGQYLVGIAAIVAAWPLGYRMWNVPSATAGVQPSPA
jgi:hypothetical protein